MRPIWTRLWLLLAALSFLAAGTGSIEAGSVVAHNLEQMTDRADLIFVGHVVGKRAEWNADRTRIYTLVTFEVDDYLKGGNATRVTTVRLLGGQVGRYLAMVPGTPQFGIGEEVLLFCAGSGARIPSVLGLSLGKFSITTDRGGERIVKRDISTLMVANHDTRARKPGDPISRYRLTDIRTRIEGYQR